MFKFNLRLLAITLAGCMITMLAGCAREEPIRTYRVAKDESDEPRASRIPSEPAPPVGPIAGNAAADGSTEPTDRMLAAIVTNGNRVWSFKFTGPLDKMAGYEGKFREILKSLNFDDTGKPTWKLPGGWTELPASGMRFASLQPDPNAKEFDFSIIVLPAPQDLLANCNRWRGQMGLPEVDASQLSNVTQRVTTASGQEATILDIEGKLQAGMMGPFAGAPPAAAQAPQQPPPAVRESSTESPLRLTVPPDWSARPTRLSQIHLYEVADDDQSAEISVSVLSRAGGDLLANVNRWRSQLGMSPWEAEELATALTDRTIAEMDAKWIELIPEEGTDGQRATIGAIGNRGDSAWFFKITGDKDLVLRERDRFEAFLRSIEFHSN